jgi:L-alanine-DL-glutamate epimerase-like enolase superfamily enzyme
MKLNIEPYTINLKTTFRIAHGASDQRHNVFAALEHDGLRGSGEGAAVVYHGETQAGIIDYLEGLRGLEGLLDEDPARLEDILQRLPPGSRAARAAFDFALHDLWGQMLGQPLYRLLGLNPQRIPLTSYTVGMDEPQVMAERARQSGYPIIKVKLGSGDDEAMLAAIRLATPARLRVDANAGWSRQQAAALIPRLVQYDLEFVEQPLPVGDIDGLRWLRAELRAGGVNALIFADESVKSARDVAAHAGAVDGVVIKLMKTGVIREGLRAIHTARSLDMQVMLSCMVETSLGVTAAAHLAPLCDYVDLDGPLLIANDPFTGVQYDGARMILSDKPGIGVSRREPPGA